MINIDLQDLIYMVSDLINLFLSGFIFMTIYNWLTNTEMHLYIIGIWSLFINTLIKTIFSALHIFVCVHIDFNEYLKSLIYVLFAIISAFIVVKIRNSELVKKVLDKLVRKTVSKDIFSDLVDKKRTILYVYLKDSDFYYSGVLKLREEKGESSYIALIDYILCNKTTCEIVKDYTEYKMAVTINLQDEERIEFLYEDDSETWKWLNNDNEEDQEN